MADSKALVIQAGQTKQVPDADSILCGAGLKSVSGTNLTITSGSSSIILATAIQFAANVGATVAAGTSAFDFSGGTGLFKTSTGAVTVGPGAVTVSGATTLTAAGTALTVNNNTTLSGALLVSGTADIAVLDRSGTISIGATSGTSITIGRTGQLCTVAGNFAVSGTETVTGATVYNGAVTLGDAEADDITVLGSMVSPLRFKREAAYTLNAFQSTTLGTAGSAGTYTAGRGSNASGATAGAAGGAVSYLGAQGGDGTATLANGSGGAATLDGGAAGAVAGGPGGGLGGAVQIGNTNAASVGIGRAGIATTITGTALSLAAGLNLSGAAGAGAVSFGSMTGAMSLPTGQVTWAGAGGSLMSLVSTGAAMTLTAGAASTWSTSSGALTLTSAAAATWSTSAGALTVSGAGGLTLDASAAALNIGNTNASAIGIGRSGITTTITGGLTQLTGAVSLSGNAASSFTTSAGALTLTSAAAATWSTTAGGLTITSAGTATWSVTTGSLALNASTGIGLQYNAKNALRSGVAGNPSATGAFTSAKSLLASGTATLTLWGTPAAGDVGYLTSTAGTAAKAIATALGTSRFAGVYDGNAEELVTYGVVGMTFVSGLTSLTAGDPVFLSEATAGKVTKTAPSTAGQVVAELGILLDSANYNNGAGSVHAVLIQPKAPVLL